MNSECNEDILKLSPYCPTVTDSYCVVFALVKIGIFYNVYVVLREVN